ncbi:MAG: glycoside hydrolase [Acidobacteria bacterium]|nr:glycoside hydrolase [Acidobacteriota bacterium]MBW4044894.1 glycoside hydrolase [Acidobacteriota bacterium]
MKILRHSLAVLMALTLSSPGIFAAQPRASNLQAGFERPPAAAKLRCYWWWLNGNTTAATITRDLTAMKSKGYGGAILVDANGANQQGNADVPAGPEFGSPQWTALYLHALKVAKQLGLEISLNITSGWNLGGPSVPPEDASKILTFSRQIVNGGGRRSIALASPPLTNNFYRQIAILAYPLRRGAQLPGEAASGRRAIGDLPYKAAFKETGFSMPPSSGVLRNLPPAAGEADTLAGDVINVSAFANANGLLQWTFPSGTWEVLRIGYTNSGAKVSTSSGAWQGLAIDYMSRRAFDHYWRQTVAPLLDAARPYLGTSLRYLVTDSWELGGTNWTEGFRHEFLARRVYDPLPYLPVIAGRIVQDRATSNRFLADLRRTVGDLIVSNHYDYFAEHAAKYGLGIHPESGGPHGAPIDALETFRNAAFAQTEFWAVSGWHRVKDNQRFFVKEASSAAHIYGKPYAAAEGFTSMGLAWAESPGANLKPTFDQALTEGLNRLIWHEFTSVPKEFGVPGREYFAGTHLNPNTTWWNQAGPILLAMNRAQFLMQQGRSISDLLYYRGDQVPGFVRVKADDPAHVLPGYDYDVTDEDALLHRITWSAGRLATPEGLQYRALALPRSGSLSLPALRWIERYVKAGGLLIGSRPQGPLGLLAPQEQRDYDEIANRMWQGCEGRQLASYGKGRIYCTLDSHAALLAFGVAADFSYSGEGTFDYIHRRTASADIYFVRNESNKPAHGILNFRIHGRTPELWQMDTGAISPAPVYTEHAGRTAVPLSFPASGSAFVIFRQPATLHAVQVKRDGANVFPSAIPGSGLYATRRGTLATTEPGNYAVDRSDGSQKHFKVARPVDEPKFEAQWKLTFPAGWGAPAAVSLAKFDSWTASSNPDIRYFSGTAVYHGTLDVPADAALGGKQVWLDLGDVHEVATVMINGKQIETLWHAPFRVRIDQSLHAGSNRVEVHVTNLWPNRLIGDLQPGAHRYTQTNVNAYKKDSPLMPSGLLSPLSLSVATLQGSR